MERDLALNERFLELVDSAFMRYDPHDTGMISPSQVISDLRGIGAIDRDASVADIHATVRKSGGQYTTAL